MKTAPLYEWLPSEPMRIAITGGSGFIGSALVDFLQMAGHTALIISRQKGSGIFWDPIQGKIDTNALANVDVIVHLAGENIGSLHWNEEKKRKIKESRLKSLELLQKAKAKKTRLIVASAIGYFGDRGSEVLKATSPPGTGFLSEVCQSVEATAKGAVICRFGLVLSPKGGLLKRLLVPLRLGLGTVLGGDQYMSWITLDDLVAQLYAIIVSPHLKGPFNCCSENPITHREFMRILADTLHRPLFLKIPKGIVRWLLGEASQPILNSTRAIPDKNQLPYFRFSSFKEALEHLLT